MKLVMVYLMINTLYVDDDMHYTEPLLYAIIEKLGVNCQVG